MADHTYLVVAHDDYMEKKKVVRVDAVNPETAVKSKGMAGYDNIRVYRCANDENGNVDVVTERELEL